MPFFSSTDCKNSETDRTARFRLFAVRATVAFFVAFYGSCLVRNSLRYFRRCTAHNKSYRGHSQHQRYAPAPLPELDVVSSHALRLCMSGQDVDSRQSKRQEVRGQEVLRCKWLRFRILTASKIPAGKFYSSSRRLAVSSSRRPLVRWDERGHQIGPLLQTTQRLSKYVGAWYQRRTRIVAVCSGSVVVCPREAWLHKLQSGVLQSGPVSCLS